MSEKELHQEILDHYRKMIATAYPSHVGAWPILSGYNVKVGTYGNWIIAIYEHTANPVMMMSSGIGVISDAIIGVPSIDDSNKELVRNRLEKHFRLKAEDGVILVPPNQIINSELNSLRTRHESVMGLLPRKVFLSHKGIDKPLVREYHQTLQLLGFEPWLDEDAMVAGTELERGLLQGFKESCAAVFFVTPRFTDKDYLATEVNYAIAEKRAKGNRFSIITLAFSDHGTKGAVPDLLRTYIYKEPKNDLDALREIIRALPVTVGEIRWRV